MTTSSRRSRRLSGLPPEANNDELPLSYVMTPAVDYSSRFRTPKTRRSLPILTKTTSAAMASINRERKQLLSAISKKRSLNKASTMQSSPSHLSQIVNKNKVQRLSTPAIMEISEMTSNQFTPHLSSTTSVSSIDSTMTQKYSPDSFDEDEPPIAFANSSSMQSNIKISHILNDNTHAEEKSESLMRNTVGHQWQQTQGNSVPISSNLNFTQNTNNVGIGTSMNLNNERFSSDINLQQRISMDMMQNMSFQWLDFKVLLCIFLLLDLYIISYLKAAKFFNNSSYPTWLKEDFNPLNTIILSIVLFTIGKKFITEWTKKFCNNEYIDENIEFNINGGNDISVENDEQKQHIFDEKTYVLLHALHSIFILVNISICFWYALYSGILVVDSVECFKVNESLAIGFYISPCLWSLMNISRMDTARNILILAFIYFFYRDESLLDLVFCLAMKTLLVNVGLLYYGSFNVGSRKWMLIDIGIVSVTIHLASWVSIRNLFAYLIS